MTKKRKNWTKSCLVKFSVLIYLFAQINYKITWLLQYHCGTASTVATWGFSTTPNTSIETSKETKMIIKFQREWHMGLTWGSRKPSCNIYFELEFICLSVARVKSESKSDVRVTLYVTFPRYPNNNFRARVGESTLFRLTRVLIGLTRVVRSRKWEPPWRVFVSFYFLFRHYSNSLP